MQEKSKLQEALDAQAAADAARYREIVTQSGGKATADNAAELVSIGGRLNLTHAEIEADLAAFEFVAGGANVATDEEIRELENRYRQASERVKACHAEFERRLNEVARDELDKSQAWQNARIAQQTAITRTAQLKRDHTRIFDPEPAPVANDTPGFLRRLANLVT